MRAALTNTIIIIILLFMIVTAIKSTIAHFKGEGACCGGGGTQKLIRPRRLKKVLSVTTVHIKGMMCDHCAARIQNALNSLEGINAKVNLNKETAVIKSDREMNEARIKEVIADLGYAVASMEEQK